MHGHTHHNVDEQFDFTPALHKKVVKAIVVGLALLGFGIFGLSMGWFDDNAHSSHHGSKTSTELVASAEKGHGHDAKADHSHASASAEHGHHEYHWFTRVKADLWHANVFFTGIALIGVFFLAVQYITWAGWSAVLKRILESFGYFIPFGGIMMLIYFILFHHDIFHWTHSGIMDVGSPNYDEIIAGKKGFLNLPFYLARMVIYFGLWYGLFLMLRKQSLLEDLNGGIKYHKTSINISAAFVVIFGVTSSMSAWDWVMSIDTHWYSTMFGWYVFASWFVSGISTIVLVIILLKQAGYLDIISENHLHDLGKFMFAFSIFWTYIWFSQFLLTYYANIPEESVYFSERFFYNNGAYLPFIIASLIINFLFPFLFLMTRDAKRHMTLLKVGAIGILLGHWIDFYNMIMPAVLKEHGGFNLGTLFVELGIAIVYVAIFAYFIMKGLSKAPLIAKNHPMLEESIHHHV